MKKTAIKVLEWCLSRLETPTNFPERGLAYDSAIKAIKAQSDRGRKTFYFRLVNEIEEDDKIILLKFLCYDKK